MAVEKARLALEALVREAADQVVTSEAALAEQRGAIAVYNSARDARFRDLRTFGPAAQAVAGLPKFTARIGAQSTERATLQIVYNCFTRAAHPGFDADDDDSGPQL